MHALCRCSVCGAPPAGPIGLTLKTLLQAETTMIGQPIRFPQTDAQLTVVLADGTHVFSAGQGLAEIVNSWHNGRNLGDKPCRFLIVFAGQKGTPNLVRP